MASTPLQKLDDAVHDYLSEIGEDGNLSGWVLAYQTSKLTADPDLIPLCFSSSYSMSPSTSGELGVGLARLVQLRLERALTEGGE